MSSDTFNRRFFELTGYTPLAWQERLYREWSAGDVKPVIDLPTGLGKTMVMAIWLIVRENHPERIPTRLVYVVDRRTVVDQATDLAQRLRLAFGTEKLAISTLRGQLADNREWTADPARPSIVIGTVDLIGSALLFSGYRSSMKCRPLEAGLLGHDSLLVLDEAHLSAPFEQLLLGISRFQKSIKQGMRVVRMSATSAAPSAEDCFLLEKSDLADPEIGRRLRAAKRLHVPNPVDSKALKTALASAALTLTTDSERQGKRIVVFTRKPKDARSIADAIRTHGATKGMPGPYKESVEVLTGTMRGLERDELVEKPVLKRFLDGSEDPRSDGAKRPVFLVSTSAGEVGFDLNADHLVGDATTLDSWIQRLGRVNRRGKGEATVVLIKDNTPADKTAFDKACIAATRLLVDGMDVSPEALAALSRNLTAEEIAEASSPKPTTLELTDVLLDAWSMTSVSGSMPGRPDVGPWLRGAEPEQAQTAVAWRSEVDLFDGDPSVASSTSEKALAMIFAKHPIRPHESLTVPTGHLIDVLKRITKSKERRADLTSTRVAVRFPRGQVVCRSLQELIDRPGPLYADSTLILPARFGGLTAGLLDADSVGKVRNDDEGPLDAADRDGYEATDEARTRLRLLINRTDNGGWTPQPLPGLSIPADIQLEGSYERSATLFDDLRKAKFRVRLVQPIRFDEQGDRSQSLVILAPAPTNTKKEDQSLVEHVDAVLSEAERIASALRLTKQDPIRQALMFGAMWHDEGKKAPIWQTFANNPDPNAPPKGKMAKSRDPKSLRGYRHELGTLLRISHQDRCGTISCQLPDDADARELALHFIATHHGGGRPHFAEAVYDPFTDAERDVVCAECIQRFGRLQRKYGWWRLAWVENLLRCADQRASADQEVTEMDELEAEVP